MIFIKNYVTDLTGEKIKLSMETSETEVKVKLNIDNKDEVDIIKSTNKNIIPSIKSSLKYISNIVNNLDETDSIFTTNILDHKPTEVAFYEKDKKIVILDSNDLPLTVGEYDEEVNTKKHYPRDMIVLICPKTYEGADAKYYLVVDPRNIGSHILTKDLGSCRIIVMTTKYPIWDKLEYPVYAYLKAKVGDNEVPVAAFKLGSSRVSKKFSKNVIEEEDINVAKGYLDESMKTLKRRTNKPRNNGSFNKNGHNRYGDKREHTRTGGFNKRPFNNRGNR